MECKLGLWFKDTHLKNVNKAAIMASRELIKEEESSAFLLGLKKTNKGIFMSTTKVVTFM